MYRKQSGLYAAINNVFWRFGNHILSLIKHIIIASYIGLSNQLDIFYMALAIFGVLITSWAVVFDVLAIPKLVNYQLKKKLYEYKVLSSSLFIFTFIVSVTFTILFYTLNDFISYLAIGFSNEKRTILEIGFIWLLPAIIFYLPYFSLCSILKSLRLFSLVNIVEFFSTLLIVCLLILFIETPFVLYWSYSLSIVFSFCFCLLFTLKKVSIGFYNPFNKDFKSLISSIPPLLFIHSCFFLFALTDRFFVSFLNDGDIAALTYATVIIFSIPHFIYNGLYLN